MVSPQKKPRIERISSRPYFWVGLAVLTLAFAAATALTWRRWPDLILDFGPQLYMPWRIAEGEVLYRDLGYLAGGPLSQYFNAALFKLFGVSFLTIIISNLTITATMLLVIYRQFVKASDAFTGTCIALVVIVVFAFAQYTGIGNNNYVAPYSHEILHGLALSVFAVALLARWLVSGEPRAAALAGFCGGLVLLTKPDIFIALALTTAAAFTLACKLKLPRAPAIRALAGFCVAALVPLLGFFMFFLRTESWRESLRLEFAGWIPLVLGGLVKDPFYQWCLGLDAPFDHLRQSAIHFLAAAAAVIACAVVFRAVKKLPCMMRRVLTAAVFGLLLFAASKFNWLGCGACLPLLCLVGGGLLLLKFQAGERGQAVIFPLLWSGFALLMLAKQGVFPRIWHTGFALAMPAFAGAIHLFLWLLPEFLEARFQVPRRPMRLATTGVLLIACVHLAQVSAQFYSIKHLAVGSGSDVILARGPAGNAVEARNLQLALDWIKKNVPPQTTLAAIPQGAMLNFLSRRINPMPCLDWNPTMLAVYGATNMTAALKDHPPDYIALVEWRSYEFGTGYFGTDGYGEDVMEWIQQNYRPVVLFGSEPLRNGLFGIKILQHRIAPVEASAGADENWRPAPAHDPTRTRCRSLRWNCSPPADAPR
jgi:hypothetical protein